MSARPPNIFTVPAGGNFLATLADAILHGRLPARDGQPPKPLELPNYTVLLPTRRAVRALQEAFLDAGSASGRPAMLLPRMRAIAEGEEDATLIAGLSSASTGAGVHLDIPPAVGELERRLVLMQLVSRWSGVLARDAATAPSHHTPAQAAQLAGELARLIDMVETENVDLTNLAGLVPDTYSEHWQQTLDFLKIIVSWWPEYLAEIDRLSPADRRNRILLAEAQRYRETPPDGPVIVAGVTGSIPATAELMQAVSELANGAIVLPGLDRQLAADDASDIIASHPEHPQCGLLRVLPVLGIDNTAVAELPPVASAPQARNRLIAEVLRPAESTSQWLSLPDRFSQADTDEAFGRVRYLSAPNSQDEAEAIALILREAAEHPERTAALVSPDRLLARRVAIRLEAWGIRVDDSAGRPFPKTVPGAFLDLVIDTVAKGFEPRALMALLKHPLCRLGRDAFAMRRAARALEIAAFRTTYLGDGLAGIEAALEAAAQDLAGGRRRGQAIQRLWQDDWNDARLLVADLTTVFTPLVELFETAATQPLSALTTAHVAVAEALAALPAPTPQHDTVAAQEPGSDQDQTTDHIAPTPDAAEPESELWRDEAGTVGAQLFAALLDPGLPVVELTAADYPDFYRTLVATEAVRPQIPTHPRIFIWGPFEARLQQPDVVILGSLNDGTWPEAADPGPWLNRPMRKEIGLPSPEEQIGYAAHDFTQLLGADTVYLTRSEIVDGNPTVPSRWLMRLEAVLDRLDANDVLRPDRPWLAWARLRDAGTQMPKIARPEPKPPLALRPRKLSVSSIETWIANPYALYAQRILKLDSLQPLGSDPDAALRGSVIHEALGRYIARFPASPPADPAAELIAISETIFAELRSHPRVAAFWIERFRRFATWFAGIEAQLRGAGATAHGEISGSTVLELPGGPFTLTARADRIDAGPDGIVITDYKTAANMSDLASRAKSGRAPQLLLEALIAGREGFARIPHRPVTKLRYVSASGGDPPGAIADIKVDDLAGAIAAMESQLGELVTQFDNPDTPYTATRRAAFRYDYDDYAHLARVAEWAGENDGDDSQ